MSSFVRHQASARTSARIALLIGLVWAALIGGIWFAYRGGAEPGGFLHFIARFHVLIVHMPIGLIFLALAIDFLGHFTAFAHLRPALPFVLWLSFLSGIGATVVGYLLMTLEDYSGRAMDLHLYFGLAVVVLTLFALVFSLKGKRLLTGLGTAAAAFATAASGHFGGAMVHESSYLTQYAPEMVKPALEIGLGGSHMPDEPKEAVGGGEKPEIPVGKRLVYGDFVAPILANTCNECHNENKTKGKLRTDTHEQLIAGAKGSDYPTIVPGAPDESELISRVLLPHDDDEFMPPQGDPLQAPEIELLKLWIKAGAKTETTVAELGDDPAVAATVAAVAAIHADGKAKSAAEAAPIVSAVSAWDALSPEEQQARLDEVAEAAEKHHFSVMPISADDGRLKVNVINAAKDFGDEQLKLLGPVADRIAWLDLARSQVTDEGMSTVRSMGGLERLHLENTAVGDAGIAKLAGLPKLEYLNLYGTKVGNGILETFKSLPALKKVYVWQTAVNADQAKAYERSVNLEINTGVEVPETPPVTEKKAEAPKPEAPKPSEPKPEAPKAEAPKPANPPAQPAANASGGTPEPRQPAAPAPKPAEPKPEAPKAEAPKPATPAPKPEEKKPEAPQPTEKKEA